MVYLVQILFTYVIQHDCPATGMQNGDKAHRQIQRGIGGPVPPRFSKILVLAMVKFWDDPLVGS